MNPDSREAMLEMAELAAKAISKEFPDSKPAVMSAHLEAAALSERVKGFKIETISQGFSCECGAGGAIQTKPEHIAWYCPICGKHSLADGDEKEMLRNALNDLLNDCINFDGGKLTDIYMKQASDILKLTDHDEQELEE